MPKVLLTTDGITPFVIGGMQKHSYYLAKLLPQFGIQLTLIHCVGWNEDLVLHQDLEQLLFADLEAEKREIAANNFTSICIQFPAPKKFPGHYLRESYEYSEKVFETIQDNILNYDFIYAKGFSAWKLIKEKQKGLACPPIGVKFHGLNMFQKAVNIKAKLEHFMFRPAVKYNILNADYVFSYGGKITTITKKLGIPFDRILEFPTGIGLDWLDDSIVNHSKRTFLFIGRYERLKGIEELNEAIKQIQDNYEFDFLFVGPIPAIKRIDSKKVKYFGKVMDVGALKNIYKQADVVICPSYSEGMPNVIMEGMAQSLTVIATDVGAVNAMVDDTNGWLLDYTSIKSIKNALINAIEIEDNQLNRLKKAAFKKVKENYLWTTIAFQLATTIKKRAK